MKKRIYAGAGASALIAIVALAATVSGAFARSGATPLPASSCSAIQNSGGQYLIASDLPLQGSGRTQTSQMTRAIKFILKPARLEGGQVLARLPELRRLDCAGRQVGLGQVLGERERLRAEQSP